FELTAVHTSTCAESLDRGMPVALRDIGEREDERRLRSRSGHAQRERPRRRCSVELKRARTRNPTERGGKRQPPAARETEDRVERACAEAVVVGTRANLAADNSPED